MKAHHNITIDFDLSEKIQDKAREKRLTFSTLANTIFAEYFEDETNN